MLKHLVFGLLWLAGLFIGPWLDDFTPGSIPAWLVLFGGVWIMLCQAVRDEIGEWQVRKRQAAASAEIPQIGAKCDADNAGAEQAPTAGTKLPKAHHG